MTKLLIVESPSKAKTIGKYLGHDYIVKASVGHVRDLPKSNKNALDIEGGFIPHYEIVKKKEAFATKLRGGRLRRRSRTLGILTRICAARRRHGGYLTVSSDTTFQA